MNSQDEKIIEEFGWTVECWSPFETRHVKDLFDATGFSTHIKEE